MNFQLILKNLERSSEAGKKHVIILYLKHPRDYQVMTELSA